VSRWKDTPCRYIYREMPCTAKIALRLIDYLWEKYPSLRDELIGEREFFNEALRRENGVRRPKKGTSSIIRPYRSPKLVTVEEIAARRANTPGIVGIMERCNSVLVEGEPDIGEMLQKIYALRRDRPMIRGETHIEMIVNGDDLPAVKKALERFFKP
jgi:hypothetical protein